MSRVIKCYNCSGEGHFARECPSEPIEKRDRPTRSDPKCYQCQRFGHIAKDCKENQKPRNYDRHEETRNQPQERRGPREFREKRSNGPRCYNCQKTGHMARDCKLEKKVDCYNCGNEGHIARDCHEDRKAEGAKGVQCYKCHEDGHIARQCPNKDN